jgi:hypothetical protein
MKEVWIKNARLGLLASIGLALLAACNNGGGTATVKSGTGGGWFSSKPSAPQPVGTDLAPQTGDTGGFTRLKPEECGIDFVNQLTDKELIARALVNQSGVASGDYHGDGNLDVFLCGLNSPNKLFHNEGGFKFKDVTAEAGEGLDGGDNLADGAVFADFNGDGKLDLYVCNRVGTNQLFINQGNGKFKEEGKERGLAVSEATISAAVFDADNDGDLDVFLANNGIESEPYPAYLREKAAAGRVSASLELNRLTTPGQPLPLDPADADKYYTDEEGHVLPRPNNAQLFINDGTGHFTDKSKESGLDFMGWSLGALACDFSNDGWTDLYVSSDFETPDRYFLNNKDGTFKEVTADYCRKTPWYGMGVDSGDVNGDGLPDIYVADMLAKDYQRSKRESGEMHFGRHAMLYDQPQPQMRNQLFINRGAGRMSEVGVMCNVNATDWTWSVRIADLDSDGYNDIYASNGFPFDNMDVDLNTRLMEMSKQGMSVDEIVKYRDSLPNYFSDDYIFQGGAGLKFKQPDNNWGMHDQSMGCGVSVADYDGDGDLDVIMNNTDAQAGVWRNDIPQGNQVLIDLKSNDNLNQQAVGARVWAYCGQDVYTQDVILARGYATGESNIMHLGLGKHEQIDKLVIRWPDLTTQEHTNLAVGKRWTIQQGKNLAKWAPPAEDPLFAQADAGFVQKEQDTQAVEFEKEPLLPLQQTTLGTGVGVCDYNGDGKLDAYFAGAAGQSGQFMTGDGSGKFSPDPKLQGVLPAGAEEMGVLWFDADGDGRADLLVTSGGEEAPPGSDLYQPKLLLNKADGFHEAPLPKRLLSTGCAIAGDVNGDGALDLLLCGHIQQYAYMKVVPSALWLNDGKGNFTDATEQYLKGFDEDRQITEAQFADVNGDGKLDIVAARFFGTVELWTGDGKGFTKSGDLTPTGWWRSVAVGDFNNDGNLDIVAGNVGDNTKYHPKDKAPITLFANDFDHNGTRDLVEVKYGKLNGTACMLPGRGRSCSGYAISYIPQKFPTWTDFSNATLEQVYGDGLATAERYDATKIESVLLLGDGHGKFTSSDLPGTAQWAPVFGIGVGDFNCDGNLDLFLGDNFHRTQPETGNWQTGYGSVLLGDGKGGFDALEPHAAGISMPEDNRGVIPADYNGDGQLDLLVSMSDAPAQVALRQKSASGGTGLEVTLQGKAPNTAGIGAKLALKLSDGRTLYRIVQAGQGYLSSYCGPVHFGVPAGVTASELDVTWPDGSAGKSTDLASGKATLKQ